MLTKNSNIIIHVVLLIIITPMIAFITLDINISEQLQIYTKEHLNQISLVFASTAGDPHTTISNITNSLPQEMERRIYLYNSYVPTLHSLSKDERPDEVPTDSFSKSIISAQRGENVTINFFNLESGKGADPHTFTILNKSYKINLNLKPGENGTANFVADQAGVFDFICIYHMPTMSGQLIVES